MKSPCHECRLKDEDKNGDECRLCEAQAIYAEGIEEGYSLKVVRLKGKKEGIMAAKRGSCVNCGRDKDLWTFEMPLPTFGLCWVCYEARKNVEKAGGSGAEVAEALQDVKEKVAGGKGLRGELKKEKKDSRGQGFEGSSEKPDTWVEETIRGPEPVTYKMLLIDPEYKCPSPFGMIFLEFKSAGDKALFDHIVESARVYRRTPDQQILWMVQEYTRKEKPGMSGGNARNIESRTNETY